ncbi:MAG: hypothetical protein NXI04_15675 [Planctomycetaceae bacterium]|nr:hypothetical protein [Planctomycetaceae bacterium]
MFRTGVVYTTALLLVFGPCAQADERFSFSRFFRHKPAEETAVVQLAKTLDKLEKKLNRDGTVVVKAPDIWGEARLTKHRQEFEREMAKEIDQFEFKLNASVSRSDQAYLASALALSAFGSGPSDRNAAGAENDLNFNQISTLLPGLERQGSQAESEDATSSSAGTSTNNSVIYQSPPAGLNISRFGAAKQIDLEPTILLDQKARFLNHLHEIRRLNEGDDTADSPGYALNLVRIPVSLMPGAATRMGHGAEVTITATPHVTEQLLPSTFRQLVINDLLDQLGPIVRGLAEKLPPPGDLNTFDATSVPDELLQKMQQISAAGSLPVTKTSVPGAAVAPILMQRLPALLTRFYGHNGIAANLLGLPSSQFESPNQPIDAATITGLANAYIANPVQLKQDIFAVTQILTSFVDKSLGSNFGSTSRRSRQPLGQTQLPLTFGAYELASIAIDLRARVGEGKPIHLSDARSFLQDELEAAYDTLSQRGSRANALLSDPGQLLTSSYNGLSIVELIRNQTYENAYELFQRRYPITNEFSRVVKVQVPGPGGKTTEYDAHLPSVTSSLVWAIIVESALLNAQLNRDIVRVSMDPGCSCNCAGEMIFCGADPSMQARQAFAEYVKCRWPVHVFALDPQSQEQNVADKYSMRREMQLALALAFSQGNVSAQKMTRYVRRLELDMETIALNRTVAAFGHGEDVFGWRFYPRVQSPPFESSATTVFRDLIGGGPSKDDLRRSWEIEPGMRECVAIVLMPSFITHMTFDVRGNYFPLGRHKFRDPSDTRTSIEDNMEMSHQIRLMENATCSIAAEANCYRDGEVQRLMRRADQIGKKLPLQTVHSRVPNENHLGGFEMFSSGQTDLAPELLDFYGMPAIDTAKDTVLFLVGNNFSVHDTHVVAGNRDVKYDLISRQVMRVVIPAGVQTIDNTKCRTGTLRCEEPRRVVDVHIATPYGVTQHLHVPVKDDAGTQPAGYRWNKENFFTAYDIAKTTATKEEDRLLDKAKARIRMAPPFTMDVQVPAASTPYPGAAELQIVVTSPQLGLSVEVEQDASFNAAFVPSSSSYHLAPQQFVALHKKVQEAFIEMYNEYYAGKVKQSGKFEIKVETLIKPGGFPQFIKLGNDLTIDCNLTVN